MGMIFVITMAVFVMAAIFYLYKMEKAWKEFDEQFEIEVESLKTKQKVDGWIDQFWIDFYAAADKDGALWLYSELPVRDGNNWSPTKGTRCILMPEFNKYLGEPLRWDENPMKVSMHLICDKIDIKSDRCLEAKKLNNNTKKD
jgi:hypothetical protein